MVFLIRFWNKRDPTPTTNLNERVLEHFRRVWFVRHHFSTGVQPYDDRGIIYLRYGQPDFITSSRKPNLQMTPLVEAIRERNMRSILGSRAPTELLRLGHPSFPIVDPVLLVQQTAYNRERNDSPFTDAIDVDRGDSDQGFGDDFFTFESNDTGIPGGMMTTRWEEWVYSQVGGGLVFTFVDQRNADIFRFALPVETANEQFTISMQNHTPASGSRTHGSGTT